MINVYASRHTKRKSSREKHSIHNVANKGRIPPHKRYPQGIELPSKICLQFHFTNSVDGSAAGAYNVTPRTQSKQLYVRRKQLK